MSSGWVGALMVALMFGGAGDAAYVAVAIAEELSARALPGSCVAVDNALYTWAIDCTIV